MSTNYRPICLSHPTALQLDDIGARDRTAALTAAANLPDHTGCDIVVGAYSYPLYAVACLPGRPGCYHRDPDWTDVGWLRLLLWARSQAPAETPAADDVERWASQATRCWPPDRLARLANLLREA